MKRVEVTKYYQMNFRLELITLYTFTHKSDSFTSFHYTITPLEFTIHTILNGIIQTQNDSLNSLFSILLPHSYSHSTIHTIQMISPKESKHIIQWPSCKWTGPNTIFSLYPLDSETPWTQFWKYLAYSQIDFQMKRMFSKKGLVESSKEENIEDVESDADLQEYVLSCSWWNLIVYRIFINNCIALHLLLKRRWNYPRNGFLLGLQITKVYLRVNK